MAVIMIHHLPPLEPLSAYIIAGGFGVIIVSLAIGYLTEWLVKKFKK